ncbi:MAG: hypothetical protein CEE38_19665 [Planctomycetes bacterium B3_Pla]|nr:MAG: hypothetical protein CEE38_19665 [Planctomycetes bacterium B3_Pla]
MARRSLLIWTIGIICLTGCGPDNIRMSETSAGRPQNSAETLDYLLGRNLPSLESVEVWTNKYGPGLKLTTAHYEIFTTLSKPGMLRRIPGFVESVYRAYNSQLPELIETRAKLTVYLFADRRQWEDFTRDFAGEQAETFCSIKAGAYYHNGACVAYDIGAERTFAVIGHEGWHQFTDRHFRFRLPSWLDEGVAMLFETGQAQDGAFYLDPARNAYRLNALAKTLTGGRMIPLKELIASNPGDALAMDRTDAVMTFYSQSYALVRFLQEADGGRRLGDYHRLLTDGLRGDWPLDRVSKKIATDRNIPRNILWNHIVGLVLFEEYVGDDFERIEKEYLAFCRQIVEFRT